MNLLTVLSLLFIITALFSYLNIKFIKLPGTIGVMSVAIVASVIILIASKSGTGFGMTVIRFTQSIDFSKFLLDLMLGFLLFASALHFEFAKLKEQRRAIFTLSTVGVIISTFLFGFLLFGVLNLLGIAVPLIYCFVFGAIVSPTDPIAVGAILKKSRIPARLETIISGESMFNDAVGLILFVTLLSIAETPDATFSWGGTAKLFGQEVIGGVGIGMIAGFLAYQLMKTIDDFQTILLLSIALVFGIALVATKLHASTPLAMVAAGLVIGNHDFGEERHAHKYLVEVWKLMDEVLNTILFVMIGLQLVVLPFLQNYWVVGLVSIVLLLIARFASILLPAIFVVKKTSAGNLMILTWAGLRGGISVAMALSMAESDYKEMILAATYFIVIFSVVVQGLSLNKVIDVAAGEKLA